MERRRCIVLLGNSVILGAVGASLKQFPQNEVISFSPELREGAGVAGLKPDVILFDLNSPRSQTVLSLLESGPCPTLIGVNHDSNIVKVWSGRQLLELTMNGLLDVMNKQLTITENSHHGQ